ncbi:toxin [Rickettsiaceae bacterium]|nr:toxin [Rickettsiaceae bacterium]
MEYYFDFSSEKNTSLLKNRGICFEHIISLINQGHVLDVMIHPNQERYPSQKIYVIDVDGYCYLVPYVQKDREIFLKTIIPSRKATKHYLNNRKNHER